MWLLSRVGHPALWLAPFADKLLLITTESEVFPISLVRSCLMALRGDSMLYCSVRLQWASWCDVSNLRFFWICSAEPALLLQCNWEAEDKQPARAPRTWDRGSSVLLPKGVSWFDTVSCQMRVALHKKKRHHQCSFLLAFLSWPW